MLPNAQPRPRPKLLDKRDAQRDLAKIDREERAKCKARSGGYCEVLIPTRGIHGPIMVWCRRRATENHHLISGIGRRNRGRSILAAHRLDVCKSCHQDITNHVLVPCVDADTREYAASVRYERRT